MKEDYQKALKKLTLFFLSNRVPFNGWNYQKEKSSGTSDQSLFRLQNKFKNICLFVTYYLTKFDYLMLSSYWIIPKITSANLCKSINDIINYSTSMGHFWIWKLLRGREKITKFEYLGNEKSFLDEIKDIFHSFFKLKLIKNSGHKV